MQPLLDLVVPRRCVGCGRPGDAGCASCVTPLLAPATVAWPRPTPPGLPVPFAVAPYDDTVRALVLGWKEHGASALAPVLARALARSVVTAVDAVGADHAVLVPAPSEGSARRIRGGDVVLDLARRAATHARRVGADVAVVPAVRHSRRVADSAGLTAQQRAANVSGAFVVRRSARRLVAGRLVVLVDDLVTTGATLAETARALRESGADVRAAATVAATARRR